MSAVVQPTAPSYRVAMSVTVHPYVLVRGDVLRNLRLLGGDNLRAFAARTRVSRSWLHQIETTPGYASVGPAVYLALCAALGLDPADNQLRHLPQSAPAPAPLPLAA